MNPADILNDPSLTSAQGAYNTAQTAANTSGQQDITLPQMLQQALTTSETNNNPVITQQGKDLANYQAVTGNAGTDQSNETAPSMITSGPGGTTAAQPLPGDVQRMMVSNKQQMAAAPLNADNLILAMQNLGVLNTIHAIAASHASDTQKLTDQASLAQKNYEDILNKLSTKANLALGYNQLGMSFAQLQEQQREFNKSATQQALNLPTQIQTEAKTNTNFDAFASKWLNNPAYTAGGGNAQTLYDLWQQQHPSSQPSDEALVKYGLKTGKPLQTTIAGFHNLMGNLINPNGGGGGKNNPLLSLFQGLLGPVGGTLNIINKDTGWSL